MVAKYNDGYYNGNDDDNNVPHPLIEWDPSRKYHLTMWPGRQNVIN